jgi:hypothetical protein
MLLVPWSNRWGAFLMRHKAKIYDGAALLTITLLAITHPLATGEDL